LTQLAVPSETAHAPGAARQPWLYVLFFFSGFPALIYQIVWQRALFTIYGVNVESVTVVVTAFMLGLGLGSLAGGRLSRTRLPLVALFAAVELATAAYGALSLPLFHKVALWTAGAGTLETAAFSFALIVAPTILMGSTLPILLAYLVRSMPNVGRATGMLYFVNTLGSATACFVAGEFTMRYLGMSGSVRLAAGCNAAIGVTALLAWRGSRTGDAAADSSLAEPVATGAALPLWAAMLAAAISGFIALGYEIVWYRTFSWASGTNPKTFAFMLGFYLAGLALGSLAVEERCRTGSEAGLLRYAGVALLGGNAMAVLVTPIFAQLALELPWKFAEPIGMLGLACAAALLGTTFPLLCHLAVPPNRSAGQGLSLIYLANIIGSAAGSFVAGFVLTELFPLWAICSIFGIAGVLLGTALLLNSGPARPRWALPAALAALCVAVSASYSYRQVYENLCFKVDLPPFVQIVENRHGVVAVAPDNKTVMGGGIYDGRFNVDPLNNSNQIVRCYALFGYLSRVPRHVLMVGLSSGSWAQVVANHPDVESLTIVEINPGYLKLIPRHPEVASLLANPKVHIVIDDGHRWLLRHPQERFDLVVMNTTYFWRANATNLLSREFLELVRSHLEPGGTHFYNTTFSHNALLTAITVFPYAVRVAGFIAVSDAPLRFHSERWQQLMAAYRIDGRPVLDPSSPQARTLLNGVPMLAQAGIDAPGPDQFFEHEASLRKWVGADTVVTDDNMAVEWRGQEH
jgi:spermidine synthase